MIKNQMYKIILPFMLVVFSKTLLANNIEHEFKLAKSIDFMQSLPQSRNREEEVYRDDIPDKVGGITAIVNICIHEEIHQVVGIPTTQYFFNNKYITKFYLLSTELKTVILGKNEIETWANKAFLSHVEYEITKETEQDRSSYDVSPLMFYVYFRSDHPVSDSLNNSSMSNLGFCTLKQKDEMFNLSQTNN